MKPIACISAIGALTWSMALCAGAGPLADYVNAPDPAFTSSLAHSFDGPGFHAYVLDMTSQSWKDGQVTPALWKHWVTIVVPETVSHDKALLIVSGGNNEHTNPPGKVDSILAMVATATQSVVVNLQGVPNEPVTFADEGRTRTEDEIIAYTFDKYLLTGDSTWPLLCPMVKSAVRAMDATQAFCREQLPQPIEIAKFVITGGSKRGWTSWLTATTDPRILATAPIVIDMLNLDEQMARQFSYYNAYSEAIQDYTDFDIQGRVNTPEGKALLEIVDPFEYRGVLTMPKFILLGAGDQYWTVDAAELYFRDLSEPKYIRYQPNADHGLEAHREAIVSLMTFYNNVITDTPMPRFTWDIQKDGTFHVAAQDAPKLARLWTAHAPAKDFRLMTIGPAWTSVVLEPVRPGEYAGRVEPAREGFVAFFIELVYPGSLGMDWSLTTIAIIPENAK